MQNWRTCDCYTGWIMAGLDAFYMLNRTQWQALADIISSKSRVRQIRARDYDSYN